MNKLIGWIKYLITKVKAEDSEIKKLQNEIDDIKKKEEILGKSVLNLYQK